MSVAIDIKTAGVEKAVQDIAKVTQAEQNLANETTTATKKVIAAKKEYVGISDKINAIRKEEKVEGRMQNFVMNQTREVFGAAALALTAFGLASEGASTQQKKMSTSVNEGFMAFQGLEFALGAVPYGPFIAGAVGAAVALRGMITETEEEKKKIKEMNIALAELNYQLGNISSEEYIATIRKEVTETENAVRLKKEARLSEQRDIEETQRILDKAIKDGADSRTVAALASTLSMKQYSQTSLSNIKEVEVTKLTSEKKLFDAAMKTTQSDIKNKQDILRAEEELAVAKEPNEKKKLAIHSSYAKQIQDVEYNSLQKLVVDNKFSQDVLMDYLKKLGAEKITNSLRDAARLVEIKRREAEEINAINQTWFAYALDINEKAALMEVKSETAKEQIRYNYRKLRIDQDHAEYVRKNIGKANEISAHKEMTNAILQDELVMHGNLLALAGRTDYYNTLEFGKKYALYKKDTERRDAELEIQRQQALKNAVDTGKDVVQVNKYYDDLVKKNKVKDAQDKSDFSFKYAIYENETEKNKAELEKQRADAITEAEKTGMDANKINAYYDDLNTQNKKRNIQEVTKTALEVASQIGQTIVDIAASGHENNIQMLEREKSDKLDAIDAQINAAGGDEKKKAELIKKREEAEIELNKKISIEKAKAWQAEKEGKLAMAVINGAVAFTAALPNYILAAVVAASTTAQVGIIASQKMPKFHTGGIIGDQPLASNERVVIGEVGEAIVTKKQMNEMVANGGSQAKNLTINFNSPVSETEMVTRAIRNVLYETGQPIDKVFVNTSANRSIN